VGTLDAIVPALLPALDSPQMQDRTQTLAIGSPAPDFTLSAANLPGSFRLSEILRQGPVIVEFLRGTW
jgi:hypothetical protein